MIKQSKDQKEYSVEATRSESMAGEHQAEREHSPVSFATSALVCDSSRKSYS